MLGPQEPVEASGATEAAAERTTMSVAAGSTGSSDPVAAGEEAFPVAEESAASGSRGTADQEAGTDDGSLAVEGGSAA